MSSAHFLFLMWLQESRVKPGMTLPPFKAGGNERQIKMYLRMNKIARTHIVGVICLALPVRA